MTDEDFEIEYLEEDADIVQQCVQGTVEETAEVVNVNKKLSPLLIERVPSSAKSSKRKKKDEEDSDYDPSEDAVHRSRSSVRLSKKPKQRTIRSSNTVQFVQKQIDTPSSTKKKVVTKKEDNILSRRRLNIQIPDYEDPLCLPVRSVKRDGGDVKRLKDWNDLCLNHFKHSDTSLMPDNGAAVSSKRTIVLRNVKNKLTGKVETTIWSKTAVQNEENKTKSEVFQCVLPKYREKKILAYTLAETKKHKTFQNKTEVILSSEDHSDRKALVVYNPQECLSAVYKLVEEPKHDSETGDEENKEQEKKRYLKELTCCKICAPCYQVSWRGARKTEKTNIKCVVCSRTYVSIYNLLTHLKVHTQQEIRKHKRAISRSLANIIHYHYKCRICQQKFSSIKELRRHVVTHKGSEVFQCEVGNHVTS